MPGCPDVVASPTAAASARPVVGGGGTLGDADDERTLRRLVGPVALAVRADLALDANADNAGVRVATTSARRVAAHLGVGKDTAARALRRLVSMGLLVRRPQRGTGGRFGAGSYELHMVSALAAGPCPSNGDTVAGGGAPAVGANSDTVPVSAAPVAVDASARPKRRGRASGRSDAGQLSLLDVGPGRAGRGEPE